MFVNHKTKCGVSSSKMGQTLHFKKEEMLHHGNHILYGCEERT
jgi:hypothetical protein